MLRDGGSKAVCCLHSQRPTTVPTGMWMYAYSIAMVTITCCFRESMQALCETLHALALGCLGDRANAIPVDGSDWSVLHGNAVSS